MRHLAQLWLDRATRINRHPARVGSAATLALATMLLAGLAGCGTPSAQQIYDSSNGSKMRDAAVTLSGSSNGAATGSTISVTGDGEIVKKPKAAFRLHMVLQLASVAASGSVTIDAIEVKSKDYIKINTSIGGLGAFGSDKYTVTDASSASAALTPKLTNLKLVGEETIRGIKCWHITGDSKDTDGKVSTDNLWVRESDYYPVREKLSALPGVNLPSGTASSALDLALTIDFSNYDTGAVINPPDATQIG